MSSSEHDLVALKHALLDDLRLHSPKVDLERVGEAFDYSNEAHGPQLRKSGGCAGKLASTSRGRTAHHPRRDPKHPRCTAARVPSNRIDTPGGVKPDKFSPLAARSNFVRSRATSQRDFRPWRRTLRAASLGAFVETPSVPEKRAPP